MVDRRRGGIGGNWKNTITSAWWVFSIGTYREILDLLGYRIEHFSGAKYYHPKNQTYQELQTIIAVEK